MQKQSLRYFLSTLNSSQMKTLRIKRQDYILSALVNEMENRGETSVVQLVDPETERMTVANIFGDRNILKEHIHNILDIEQVAGEYAPVDFHGKAPVQETIFLNEEIDAEKLPIFKHFAGDAGRYITSGIMVAKDPETGRANLSFHRMMLKGKDRFGVSLHSMGDLWDYYTRSAKMNKDLEVAVIIGAAPALYLAGTTNIPHCYDDYMYAGAFLGEAIELVPAKTVHLKVPAHAEYVLEGRILAQEFEDEGPFAEYTGYSTSRSTRNIFKLSCITCRRDAIWQELVPGFSNEHIMLSQYTREIILFHKLQNAIPEVSALCIPKNGCHFHAYLAMKSSVAGKAKQAMMLLFGLDQYLKLIIVVDEDVDVFDEKQVLKALATNFQADTDMFMVAGVTCNRLDPSSKDGLAAKMGLDATSKGQENQVVALPAESMRLAKQLLDEADHSHKF